MKKGTVRLFAVRVSCDHYCWSRIVYIVIYIMLICTWHFSTSTSMPRRGGLIFMGGLMRLYVFEKGAYSWGLMGGLLSREYGNESKTHLQNSEISCQDQL